MINFIESFEWGGKAFCSLLLVVFSLLFLAIVSKKRTSSETMVHCILDEAQEIPVIPGKYVIEKKRLYSIIRLICDGVCKTSFATAVAGVTKLFWDNNDIQIYRMACIIILVFGVVALTFKVLADGFEERMK